jgi:zinc transport system substrate-binding protein
MIAFGCSQSKQQTPETDGKGKSQNNKLEIYTSLYPIQYVTERIGGDTVSVNSVYPPGVDAHTYEPTSREMIAIAKSDALIYLGAGMESFAETVAESLSSQDIELIEIGKDKSLFLKDENGHDHLHDDHDKGEEHEHHHHGDYDPHLWLDPLRLVEVSEIVKEALISLNPEEKAVYEENFTNLKEDLTLLDNAYKETLEKKENKHILVSHAAYGYWQDRYGIEQIAVNGLSSSNEPSQKQLTNIINKSKEYNLKYILFEQNTSNRVSEIIRDEVGAETAVIHNLEILTEEDIKNNEDYLSLMEYNLDVLDKVMD